MKPLKLFLLFALFGLLSVLFISAGRLLVDMRGAHEGLFRLTDLHLIFVLVVAFAAAVYVGIEILVGKK